MNSLSSSSSSSSPSNAFTYDVFLSFRGKDTRKTFTGHLYEALTNAGINAFIDDEELPRGENISSKLTRAIEESSVSVVVFSTNYGDSRWCLEELVKIMECRKSFQQVVLPIFYDVGPSQVIKQKGSFAKAFMKHEEWIGSDSNKILLWRNALKEAGELSGWDLRNIADGHEAKFIKKIVREVSMHLNNTNLFVASYLVGIESRLDDLKSRLDVASNNIVRMVGICGLGGIGKTTIAKAVYNEFYQSFEGRSFLSNVREIWDQVNGPVRLQKQLLLDILKNKVKVSNVDRGIMLIKERLRRKRVLVVVDDVDDMDQLYALAGSCEWFGHGSRIIITTRDRKLLEEHEVDDIYMAKELSDTESLELFNRHAFKRSPPTEGYFDLSKSAVAYCGCLPLALQVLGSSLFGRNPQEWRNTLEKLRRIPHPKIQQVLEISYNTLSDETVKDIFLHICCFFIGEDRNYVQNILDGCELFAEIGINQLLERSLVTVNALNKLLVHDLLRDMGREIVRKESPKDPSKWSRLWYHEDVFDVLRKHKGTEHIEGLSLKLERGNKISFETKAFEKMPGIRLLQLNYVELIGSYEYISKELRWLCWEGFPQKFIPENFDLVDLVTMELKYSNLIQLWKHSKLLEKLTLLDLSHSHYLTHTPDFLLLPNLKKVILEDCKSLHEVHHSIGYLGDLVLVNLKDCEILTNLPKSFYNLTSLETLNLSGCSRIDHLDEDLGEMASLTTLLADHTGIKSLPLSIGRLVNLKELTLYGLKESSFKSLSSISLSWLMLTKSIKSMNLLPPSFQGLNSLKRLGLSYCDIRDDDMPKDLGSLPSLEFLDLSGNNFHGLQSLRNLSKLKRLWLNNCSMLEVVPELPKKLSSFSAVNCTALQRFSNNVSPLIGCILDLENCHKLVDISFLNDQWRFLHLKLQGCYSVPASFKNDILKDLMVHGGIPSISLPGDDIPEWFPYVNEGCNSIRFQVPDQLPTNYTLHMFYLCMSFEFFFSTFVIVVNNTKGTRAGCRRSAISACYNPKTRVEEGHLYLTLVHISPGLDIESGDKIDVILESYDLSVTYGKIGVFVRWPDAIQQD